MGCYVNPVGMTKEEFLKAEGREATQEDHEALKNNDVSSFLAKGELPVILVDNGPFTAAAVLHSNREAAVFREPTDFRPRAYFVVPIEKLKTVSPLNSYLQGA